jgi:hypothetical protein
VRAKAQGRGDTAAARNLEIKILSKSVSGGWWYWGRTPAGCCWQQRKCSSVHLGSSLATCDQRLGSSSALQQRAPRQQLGDMRSAPRQQLSSSAACTSAAVWRHAISASAAAQLFSSVHLGSSLATCDPRLGSSSALQQRAPRQHFSDMRHALSGSTSATCDMRFPAALQRHATCAFLQHFIHMRLAPSRCTTTVHSLQQQFHLERAMWFFVLSLLFLSCVYGG